MKKPKKILALVLALATLLALSVGTLAFFTDRIQAQASATAGTLDLVLKDDGLTVEGDTTKFHPGEGISIDYTLQNAGSKSADVKETFVLTVTDAVGAAKNLTVATPEFQIYAASDVTIDSTTNLATIKAGATPLGTVSGNQLTYAVPEFILNGTGSAAETETGAIGTEKDGAYVLVFTNAADNSFQNLTLKLDYIAEAKQHRNTGVETWNTVRSETITFAGNAAYQAVPEKQ